MEDVRITLAVARVLCVFLEDFDIPRYGYDLMRQTGFPSGKLYPILARLERAGWLAKEREDIDPVEAGRPPRRLYRLTSDGAERAHLEVASVREQLAPRRVSGTGRPKPATGGAW